MLNQLKIKNFRNFSAGEFHFHGGMNLIVGKNGAGKTNLLEAIYCLLQTGKSFRPGLQPLIRQGEENAAIKGKCSNNNQELGEEVELVFSGGKKQFFRNGKRIYQDKDRRRRNPVMLFLPEDLSVFKQEAGLRRQYLDRALSETDPEYSTLLETFGRLHRTRYFLLRKGENNPAWTEEWIRKASEIIRNRIRYLNQLNKLLAAGPGADIKLGYATTAGNVTSGSAESIAGVLRQKSEELSRDEEKRKRMLFGPQLDDIKIFYQGRDLRYYASSGETKHVVFLLKIAQAEYLRKQSACAPIMLFDEFLESFDSSRQKGLIEVFPGSQLILTSCRSDTSRLFPDGHLLILK
ncbi:MAG: DNA replication and repair protein RecF [Candidatus Wallbacteria bacterium]|nr:DNA replication and repair protein RecF [Candidatus Wallbacteria bacterium]